MISKCCPSPLALLLGDLRFVLEVELDAQRKSAEKTPRR